MVPRVSMISMAPQVSVMVRRDAGWDSRSRWRPWSKIEVKRAIPDYVV